MSQIHGVTSPLLDPSHSFLSIPEQDTDDDMPTITTEGYGALERMSERERLMQRFRSNYGIFANKLDTYTHDSIPYILVGTGFAVSMLNIFFFPTDPQKLPNKPGLLLSLSCFTFLDIPAKIIANAKKYQATSSISEQVSGNPALVQTLPEHVLQPRLILRETVYLSKLLFDIAMIGYTINAMIAIYNDLFSQQQIYMFLALHLYVYIDIFYNIGPS